MNPRSLQSRALWVFGGVVSLLVVTVAAVSITVQKGSLLQLEARTVQKDLSRVRAAIADVRKDLEANARLAGAPDGLAEERPAGLDRSAGSNVWVGSIEAGAFSPRWINVPAEATFSPDEFARIVEIEVRSRPQLLPGGADESVSGLLNLPQGPWLFSAVFNEGAEGAAPVAKIAARPLDAEFVRELSERLVLPLTLIVDAGTSSDVRALQTTRSSEGMLVLPVTGATVVGWLSVPDLGGARPVVFKTEQPRELFSLGMRQLYLVILGVGVAGLIVGLCGWQIIDRWVVARMRHLRDEVSDIARSSEPAKRVEVNDTDELAELAASVNQLLEALSHRTDELGAEIRERVKVQDRLSEANRGLQATLQFRQDLSNMLVHDIRSPLTVIDFYLQIQARRLGEAAAKDQSLNLAMKSVNRLNLMLNDLLIMAKFEAGKITLNRSTFDLRGTLIRNIDEMRFLAQKRNVAIQEQLPTESLTVDLDANLLWRVIENLLTNAVKYSPDHASITVRAEARGAIPGAEAPANADHVLLSVSDEGPGIPDELHETIFEKFSIGRLDRSKLQIGLGLSFCRMIVEAQGGRIWVENNTPRGSVFCVELPAVVPVSAPAIAASANA